MQIPPTPQWLSVWLLPWSPHNLSHDVLDLPSMQEDDEATTRAAISIMPKALLTDFTRADQIYISTDGSSCYHEDERFDAWAMAVFIVIDDTMYIARVFGGKIVEKGFISNLDFEPCFSKCGSKSRFTSKPMKTHLDCKADEPQPELPDSELVSVRNGERRVGGPGLDQDVATWGGGENGYDGWAAAAAAGCLRSGAEGRVMGLSDGSVSSAISSMAKLLTRAPSSE